MYRLIFQIPAYFLSAQMALVSTFFQMFIVLGMYNFVCIKQSSLLPWKGANSQLKTQNKDSRGQEWYLFLYFLIKDWYVQSCLLMMEHSGTCIFFCFLFLFSWWVPKFFKIWNHRWLDNYKVYYQVSPTFKNMKHFLIN